MAPNDSASFIVFATLYLSYLSQLLVCSPLGLFWSHSTDQPSFARKHYLNIRTLDKIKETYLNLRELIMKQDSKTKKYTYDKKKLTHFISLDNVIDPFLLALPSTPSSISTL